MTDQARLDSPAGLPPSRGMTSMRVKPSKRRLYVVRSTYVPAKRDQQGKVQSGTGRAKELVLGSIPSDKAGHALPSDLAGKLTDVERHQVEQLLTEQHRTREFKRMGLTLATAHDAIGLVVDGLRFYPAEIPRDQLQLLALAQQDLLRAIRARAKRQGMTLGVLPRRRKTKARDIPGQQNFIEGMA